MERGERNLTLQTVERLAAELDVDALSLLLPAAEPTPAPAAGTAKRALR